MQLNDLIDWILKNPLVVLFGLIIILGLFAISGNLTDLSHYSFTKTTPDGCSVSCIGSVNSAGGVSCDWDHKVCK